MTVGQIMGNSSIIWFSGDCNQLCTHRSTNVPLASHDPINGGNENKEGINGIERRKRGRKWKNMKEREGPSCHAIMDRKWCHFA